MESDGQAESDKVGQLVDGMVEAVFRWGVIVNLGLPFVGLIDALYIDDNDSYTVGQHIAVHVDGFDHRRRKYVLRPPGQIRVSERLRARGFDV